MTLSLRSVITTLRRHYGEPARPVSRDPFHLVLWEQVAYLVPDAQRRRAFAALRTTVGLHPTAIVAAPPSKLETIAGMGGSIAVGVRASRLRESAELVLGGGMATSAQRFVFPHPRPVARWHSSR